MDCSDVRLCHGPRTKLFSLKMRLGSRHRTPYYQSESRKIPVFYDSLITVWLRLHDNACTASFPFSVPHFFFRFRSFARSKLIRGQPQVVSVCIVFARLLVYWVTSALAEWLWACLRITRSRVRDPRWEQGACTVLANAVMHA